jgi:hypothetical protein
MTLFFEVTLELAKLLKNIGKPYRYVDIGTE